MVEIRTAKTEDAQRLLEIYDYYVKNTAITFEYATPSLEELQNRITHTLQQYPYLVLVQDGCIQGYAYAGPFKGRAAYDWSCEISIYLDHQATGQGLGRMLSEALEASLQKMGILNVYSCIAYPVVEDEYLTRNSAEYHAHLGYKTVGEFHQCANKFGRWYNMIWMEKSIGPHEDFPPGVKNYQ